MELVEIIEKLKDVLSHESEGDKKIFDKDVAAALGISKESLSIFKRKNGIPYEQIAKFCAKRRISINWILFDQLPKSLEEETEKYTRIKHFTKINASAGGGGINYDEGYEYISIVKTLLDSIYKTKYADPKNIIAIHVIGDSMEPTLLDEEVILFDKSDQSIKSGEIFIISSDAGLFVKRVALKYDGGIELISDNKTYNTQSIKYEELESVQILGRVVGKVGLID